MIVVIATCHRDHFEAKRLIEWCAELGPYPGHRLLLVFGKQITQEQRNGIMGSSLACGFQKMDAIQQREEDDRGWPFAPNQMFSLGLKWIEDTGRDAFFWLEPDATPLKEGWLDTLATEYARVGKPWMGTVFDWVSPTRYLPHLTGVACYPANLRRLNPYVPNATKIPWDVTRPDLTLPRTHRTPLIFHDWGDRTTNTAPTFPDDGAVSQIPLEAVIHHRNKDGTLIDRLRERRANSVHLIPEASSGVPLVRRLVGIVAAHFISRPKRKTLRIRRSGAFGDAIAATCVAEKLDKMGYDIVWQTRPVIQPLLEMCASIKAVEDPADPVDVDLDGAYEMHPDRTRKTFAEIYTEIANRQLRSKGIYLENDIQCTPRLIAPRGLPNRWEKLFSALPRPWIAICPRSNSFANRTVPDEIWEQAVKGMNGTAFWLGTTKGPPNIFHPWPRTMTDVTGILAVCDLLVSVDSGPLHLAAAMGIPALALLQSSSPELHITDQRDFEVIRPQNLDCLNCQAALCPIDAISPPCQHFDPHAIAAAVERKSARYSREIVSAVVTAYQPPAERLNRCLAAVLHQVSEVIVTFNADGIIPRGAMTHPKIRYVKTRLPSIGYGRNANFGARHTSGSSILFLNDDVFLEPSAMAHMADSLRDPNVGMVGCLLFYPNGKIQHGGTRRNPGDLGWGHIDHNKTEPSIKAPVEMENVTQAAALMRRKAFYESGCYDEQYYMYYEDSALSLQMRREGWRIMYNPLAYGIHDEHQTLKVLPTGQMAENLKRSRKIFDRDWGAYFKHNPANGLGNFDY